MVTLDEAAILAKVSSSTIYRWVEAEKIHFEDTPEGLPLICLNALSLSDIKGGEAVDRKTQFHLSKTRRLVRFTHRF
jgi:hypothetical protein